MKRFLFIIVLGLIVILTSCSDQYYKRGNLSYNNQNYKKAIKHYNKFLAKNDLFEARQSLANSYMEIKDYEKAELHYQEIASHEKATPQIWLNYSKALMENKKYAIAKAWLTVYLINYPAHDKAYSMFLSCEIYVAE